MTEWFLIIIKVFVHVHTQSAVHCYMSCSQIYFHHLFTTQSIILTEQDLVLLPVVHAVLPWDVRNTMKWCRKTGPNSLKSLSVNLPSYNSKVSSLVNTWPHMPCVIDPSGSDWWRWPNPSDFPLLHVNAFTGFLGNVFSQSVTCYTLIDCTVKNHMGQALG